MFLRDSAPDRGVLLGNEIGDLVVTACKFDDEVLQTLIKCSERVLLVQYKQIGTGTMVKGMLAY